MTAKSAEHQRLIDSEQRNADWKNWGPYLSERGWGTVREDYSEEAEPWTHFPHDHAHRRAYRWNEDGLGGFCNRFQNLCLAVGLWNGVDPILKERLFGLAGNEGNHGEDVKEYYFYLDGTPTHSYMKMLYRYPQVEYPYRRLVEANRSRGRDESEFELADAIPEAFRQCRYFDVLIEYAKADQEDILCRITAINRGPEPAPLHILPHVWFRNTWSWTPGHRKPSLRDADSADGSGLVLADDPHLGQWSWSVGSLGSVSPPPVLVTENETNHEALYGSPNASPFVKDGIHQAIVHGRADRLNPLGIGTKAAAHFSEVVDAGQSMTVQVRLTKGKPRKPFANFPETFRKRIEQADEFYQAIHRPRLSEEERAVQRQAFAGLLWNKQFYHYAVKLWLDGDAAGPQPPASRKNGRNAGWTHIYNLDVLSMPDKWEYPRYAAWDLAFHTVPLALIDPEWAKRQLILMLREWYMHPNGQLAAYEWSFDDVNPPVHAWAALRVYRIDYERTGRRDTVFLERVFQKLLLNFTWWVNRKDKGGNNIFQGGFLGLDNIGVFDRSKPLPSAGHLEQSDGTAWMGMYCLNMLAISLELAGQGRPYEDVATKFFEHFVYIAHAINRTQGGSGLWNREDGFYYDMLHTPGGRILPIRIRSMIGLIPLFAVETLEPEILERLPRFRRRLEWFVRYRPKLVSRIASLTRPGVDGRRLLSLVDRQQLVQVLDRTLDEAQFLSDFGVRSLSREHRDAPFTMQLAGQAYTVAYEPGESRSGLFGGNSNWRGPVWFPVNYLMIESLLRFHQYYGNRLQVAYPRGGQPRDLAGVAGGLARRLGRLFLADESGRRPCMGAESWLDRDPNSRDLLLFHEYFHGDSGAGLGASHQTGWTAMIAELLDRCGGQSGPG